MSESRDLRRPCRAHCYESVRLSPVMMLSHVSSFSPPNVPRSLFRVLVVCLKITRAHQSHDLVEKSHSSQNSVGRPLMVTIQPSWSICLVVVILAMNRPSPDSLRTHDKITSLARKITCGATSARLSPPWCTFAVSAQVVSLKTMTSMTLKRSITTAKRVGCS